MKEVIACGAVVGGGMTSPPSGLRLMGFAGHERETVKRSCALGVLGMEFGRVLLGHN